jgi:peptide/nickel transport system substrate-binding protein
LMVRLDRKAVPQVEAADNAVVLSMASARFTELALDLSKHPGDKPDFVLVMKYLMPRERLIRKLLGDDGILGNDHPVAPTYADHCDSLPQRAYDLDKAKFHLQKSGITEARVDTSDTAVGGVDMCIIAQFEAQKIGLKRNVRRNPADGYWGTIFRKMPFYMSTWSPRPTTDIILSSLFYSEAPYNESQFKSARVDQLLVDGRAQTDPALRSEIYCEIQTIIHNEAGNIIPWHQSIVDGAFLKVRGIPMVPVNSLGGGEWPEYIWLDS